MFFEGVHWRTLTFVCLLASMLPWAAFAGDSSLSRIPIATPEDPFVAPLPAGNRATRLEGVEVVDRGSETLVRIVGNGEFAYSSFQLEDPPRFVVDLEGAQKTSGDSNLLVVSATVERVRLAQFRSAPEPVSRVVFDLHESAQPWVARDADGLLVLFAAGSPEISDGGPAALELPLEATGEVAIDPEPSRVTEAEPARVAKDRAIEEADGNLSPILPVVSAEPDLDEMVVARLEAPPIVVAGPGLITLPEGAVVLPQPVAARTEPMRQEAVFVSTAVERETEPAAQPVPAFEDRTETLLASIGAGTEAEQELPEEAPALAPPQPLPQPQPSAKPEPVLAIAEFAQAPEVKAPVAETAVVPEFQASAPEPVTITQAGLGGVPFIAVAQQESVAPSIEAAEEGSGGAGGVPGFGVTNVSGQKQYFGDPISMSLKDADITEVLRSIARISALNIVIQPGVSGPVTVELDSVPWDQALEQILKINQLGMELDGNILRIAPVARLAQEAEEQLRLIAAKSLSIPLTTVMRRISYATAQELASILQSGGGGRGGGILSQRGSVIVDARTNTLIIQELPGYMDQVIQIIENLDIPEDQVMIEARIVETTKNWNRSLGFNWSYDFIADAEHGNTTGLEFPNNIDTDGGVSLLSGGANGFLNIGLGNVLNTFELDVILQAAESEGLVNVISAPKVATLNNERATIQSGLQIPVQTVANNTVTVQFVNATLRLDVTPHITAEGTVLLEINIQKREPQLAFAVIGATNAPIATREARTRVLVRDGGTAVIGGIYQVSTDEKEDRVPGLSNIPILGHLFRNKSRSNTNEELIIFITPRIIQL